MSDTRKIPFAVCPVFNQECGYWDSPGSPVVKAGCSQCRRRWELRSRMSPAPGPSPPKKECGYSCDRLCPMPLPSVIVQIWCLFQKWDETLAPKWCPSCQRCYTGSHKPVEDVEKMVISPTPFGGSQWRMYLPTHFLKSWNRIRDGG